MDLFSQKIVGPRVYLRLFTGEDASTYLHYLVNNRSFHEPFSPKRPADFYTLENALLHVDQQERVDRDQQYTFGIFDCTSDRLAGKINISGVSRAAFQSCFFGYDIDRSVKNQGYMTEAIRLAVWTSFTLLQLHRVQASIMPRNLPSQKVAEKAGFIREGYAENYLHINDVWEDHYIYSLTVERYERLPSGWKHRGKLE